MSITPSEAADIIVEAQNAAAKRHFEDDMVPWYTEHPEYLHGRTIEQIRADRTEDFNRLDVNWDDEYLSKPVTTVDGYEVQVAARFGGEGQGDEAWIVFRVNDQYFRKDGYYSSYEGTNWEDYDENPYEVVPVEKPVTFWEKPNA